MSPAGGGVGTQVISNIQAKICRVVRLERKRSRDTDAASEKQEHLERSH